MKRLEIEGKFFRMRRGILVEIPDKWLGKVTNSTTIRQRKSKLISKVKRQVNDWNIHYKDMKVEPIIKEIDELEL